MVGGIHFLFDHPELSVTTTAATVITAAIVTAAATAATAATAAASFTAAACRRCSGSLVLPRPSDVEPFKLEQTSVPGKLHLERAAIAPICSPRVHANDVIASATVGSIADTLHRMVEVPASPAVPDPGPVRGMLIVGFVDHHDRALPVEVGLQLREITTARPSDDVRTACRIVLIAVVCTRVRPVRTVIETLRIASLVREVVSAVAGDRLRVATDSLVLQVSTGANATSLDEFDCRSWPTTVASHILSSQPVISPAEISENI